VGRIRSVEKGFVRFWL